MDKRPRQRSYSLDLCDLGVARSGEGRFGLFSAVLADAISSTKRSFQAKQASWKSRTRLVATWLVYLSVRTSMSILTDFYSDEISSGITNLADVTLIGSFYQLVFSLLWTAVALSQTPQAAPTQQARTWGMMLQGAWRSLRPSRSLAARHFFCGLCNIADNLCFLGAVVKSTAAFASTLSLTGSVLLTLLMMFLVLKIQPSMMKMMLVVPLLSSAAAFSGMQTSQASSSNGVAESSFGVAALLILSSALMNSICTVYSQATFGEGAAGTGMATPLRQLSDLMGSMAPLVLMRACSCLASGSSAHGLWYPTGGHTSLLAAVYAAETICFKLTCQACGAVPIAIAKCCSLGTVYACKVLILGGSWDLWEALLGLTVLTLAAIYVLEGEVVAMQAEARASAALDHLQSEVEHYTRSSSPARHRGWQMDFCVQDYRNFFSSPARASIA